MAGRTNRYWEIQARVAMDWVGDAAAAGLVAGVPWAPDDELERAHADVAAHLNHAREFLDKRPTPRTWWLGTRGGPPRGRRPPAHRVDEARRGAVVLPRPEGRDRRAGRDSRPDRHERGAETSAGHVGTVVLFGLLGASITSISLVVRKAPPSSVPMASIRVSQAILEAVTGMMTAVLGLTPGRHGGCR